MNENPDVSIHSCNRTLALTVCGRDNRVCVEAERWMGCIQIYGSGNTVRIEEGAYTEFPCFIRIGLPDTPCFGCTCIIGRNTGMAQTEMLLLEDDSTISIGEDCMFSTGIRIWCTDSHTVCGSDGKPRLGRFVRIGNHVWVGVDAKIGKNSSVADDCIIGWGSVVAGCFDEPACVIAGAPAAVRRRGASWSKSRATLSAAGRDARMQAYAAARPAKFTMARGLKRQMWYYRLKSLLSFSFAKRERYREKADTLRTILTGIPF